jgi:hypothetical protein
VSFYVGPTKSRLHANDWAAIESAAAAGVLDETAWVELKKAIPAPNVEANLELARDLASLSVDGGVLIVGVSDKTKDVVGVPDVDALRDRIVQVASGRIYPSLYVDTTAIPHPADPDKAVVIVSVPASASAPHMVDERYWGRTSSGKRPLGDTEVERLISDRRRRTETLQSDVMSLRELDPIEPADRKHGHLYVLLRPLGHAGRTFSEGLGGRHPQQMLIEALGAFRPQWEPLRSPPPYSLAHPDGLLLSQTSVRDEERELHSFRLLFQDDGAVHAVFGGGTRPVGPLGQEDTPETTSPGQLLELIHGLVMIAGHVGSELLGYWGEWEAGIYLDRLKGIHPIQAHTAWATSSHAYQKVDYFRATRTTSREMSEKPHVVVERLVGALLTGLGVARMFLPYENPADLFQRGQSR